MLKVNKRDLINERIFIYKQSAYSASLKPFSREESEREKNKNVLHYGLHR